MPGRPGGGRREAEQEDREEVWRDCGSQNAFDSEVVQDSQLGATQN